MRRDYTVVVAVCFFAICIVFTHSHINSWNDASRLASVEALVEQGTWAIDGTTLAAHTSDVISLKGRTFSDKPPVLSFLASGVYAVLHRVLGLSLTPKECDPHASACYCFALLCPQRPDWAYYWITLTLVGLPSALMLALFYRSTALHALPNPTALVLTGVLGLGTLILPYSLVFNNHIPTAACLMGSLYALLRSTAEGARSSRWLLVAGFAAALAFTFDLAAGLFLVFFLGDALVHHRRRAWPYLLGSLAPLALMVVLDWWILGDPLPPMLHAAGYAYAGAPLYTTVAGVHQAPNVLDYSFQMLLGEHGLFAFTPVLLWTAFGLVMLLRQRTHWLWSRAVAVGLACLATTVYLGLSTDTFGGEAYGPRWFVAMTPVLFFFSAWPSLYNRLSRWLIFASLSLLSIFSAWQGALDPWRDVLPPLRLAIAAPASLRPAPLTPQQIHDIPHRLDVTFEGKARLAGYAVDRDTVQPGGHVSVMLYWQALSPINDDYVVFVHLASSAGTLSAQRDSPRGVTNLSTRYWKPGEIFSDTYRVDIPETAYAPDETMLKVGLYLPNGPRLNVQSADGQPLGDSVSLTPVKLIPRPGTLANSANVNWGNRLFLLGYDLNTRVIRAGEALSVTLCWQATSPVALDYSVFAHLTDANGSVIAANDGMPYTQPKRTTRWTPGQVMCEVRPLKLPADTAVGLYEIELGIFSEAEGRLPIAAADGHSLGEQIKLVQIRVTDT